ncbi:hypothetical protein M422DRAFT_266551 [Sphaerobolus stellatus SS14]|uniref:MULE transposase domain-containing protein n=1 Tax=Sphaerobolus stellatus (strain SS14) TaxID=990650 RepID=A0A0C9URF4_SPHS4|nr:hypothetical protein M422DRAFT_266551 [Sphaerobolus stellatus SS14]
MSSEELSKLNVNNESLPYSIKITAQDAVRRKAKEEMVLALKLGESVKLWVKRLETMVDSHSMSRHLAKKIELIAEYGKNIVCLNLTHNMCKGENKEKIFLNTIVTQYCATGKGVPLAFILTNEESHCPLDHFLKWLRKDCDFELETVMIDCSNTEALGINKAFSDRVIKIIYCYWHLGQAWEKNIKAKVHFKCVRGKEACAELVKDVRTALGNLLRATTPQGFEEAREFMQMEYADQKAWLIYLEDEYIKHNERLPCIVRTEPLESQRASKLWILGELEANLRGIPDQDYFHQAHTNIKRLDLISQDSLTRFKTTTGSVKHIARETLLVLPGYATQT